MSLLGLGDHFGPGERSYRTVPKSVRNFFVYRPIFSFEVSFDRGEIGDETYTIVYRGIMHSY